MKQVIAYATILAALTSCHNGPGGSSSQDSATRYPPSVLNDTNNMNAGSPSGTRMTDTTRKLDGSPIQGDTSTSGNGQNTGLIKDTSKPRRK